MFEVVNGKVRVEVPVEMITVRETTGDDYAIGGYREGRPGPPIVSDHAKKY